MLRHWAERNRNRAAAAAAAAGLLVTLAWLLNPWQSYTGGMAGVPGPVSFWFFAAGILALAVGSFMLAAAPGPALPRVAWGTTFAGAALAILAPLGMPAGDDPFLGALVLQLLAIPAFFIGVTLLAAAAFQRRRWSGILGIAALVLFVLLGSGALPTLGNPRTNMVPHRFDEAITFALFGLAIAVYGWQERQASPGPTEDDGAPPPAPHAEP